MKTRIFPIFLATLVALPATAQRRAPTDPLRQLLRHRSTTRTAVNGNQRLRLEGRYDTTHILLPNSAAAQVNVSGDKVTRVQRRAAAQSARKAGFTRYRMAGGNADPAKAVATLRASGVKAQLRYRYQLQQLPNDADFGHLWGLRNTGQIITPVPGGSPVDPTGNGPNGSERVGFDIGVEKAWDVTTGSANVVVAVIDSGIRATHQDLAANIWRNAANEYGRDFVDDDNDPADLNSHGTHVAGTIGAVGNNGLAITGVNWTVRMMAVRVCDHTGFCWNDDIADGIHWAVDNGAKVINLSLGGPAGPEDEILEEAVKYAEDHDVVVVMAAGNGGLDSIGDDNDEEPQGPANFAGAAGLSVAAVTQELELAEFSNFGKTTVHLAAPGNNIRSSIGVEGRYGMFNGNSGWGFVNAGEPPPPDNGWGYFTVNLGGDAIQGVSIPPDWFNTLEDYRPNTTDYAYYTTSALEVPSGWTSAETTTILDYSGIRKIDPSDQLVVKCGSAVMTIPPSPTLLPSGTLLRTYNDFDGQLGNLVGSDRIPNACRVPLAQVGFQLTSDAENTNFGIAMFDFFLSHLRGTNQGYDIYAGTSMATPHVAGVAALVRAYRPYASAVQVATAIKSGVRKVEGLASTVATGGVVNAMGALAHMEPPTNVTAAVEP